MTQHTPGPWITATHDFGDKRELLGVFDAKGALIVESAWGNCIAQSDANTSLIAAAPELLAACKAYLAAEPGPDYQGWTHPDQIRALIRAAIAKAEGVAP